jgi:MFS family permease
MMQTAPSRYKWIILTIGSLFHFSFTAAWIFVPLIEALEGGGTGFAIDLSLDTLQVASIYAAPLLAFVIFTFFGGMITDALGLRKSSIISGVFITGFGLLRGFSTSFSFLLVTSFLFGIGGGLLYPNLSKMVASWFEDQKKGTASGIYLMAGGMGQVFSLSITTAFLLPLFQFNWRWCFIFYGAFSLVIVILWIFIAKEKKVSERISNEVISLPTLKQIFLNKAILRLCLIIFFGFSILMGLTNYMADFLDAKGLVDPIYIYLASILSLGIAFGNVTLPSISDFLKKRKIFLVSCSIIATIFLLLLQLVNIGELLWLLIFCLGLMVGSIIPLCLTVSIELKDFSKDLAGTVSGLVLTFGFLGSFTVNLIFGLLLSNGVDFLICLIYLISFGILATGLSLLQKGK